MSTMRLVQLALRSIVRNTGRSLLTILGVVIGVASVVLMVAIGLGAQSEVQSRIDNLGTNLVVITPGSSERGGVSQGAGSYNRLTVDDAETLAREAALLSAVTPVILTHTHIATAGGNWRTNIYGVDVSYQEIRDWPAASGRFFDTDDVRSRRKVCVLGRTVAHNLFEGQDPVGSQIQLRRVPFEIIGVLAAKGPTAEGADQDDVILAPYTTVQTRLAGRQFIAQILASGYSERDIPGAMEEARLILQETHGLAPWQEDDFEIRDQSQLAEAARGTTRVMTVLLSAIASISLLVGGIGIMNIMLVSVTERTREIGIRRAVGARRGDVLAQFLVEAMVLSGLGGLLGAVIGIAGSWIVGMVTGWATTVSIATLVLALAFSLAVGVFFGWVPARRAAALDPIEALRHQ